MIEVQTDSNFNFTVNRVLLFLFLLYKIAPAKFLAFLDIPDVLWMPTGVFHFFEFPPPAFSELSVQIFSYSWKLLAVLCALGISYRLSSIFFFLMTLILVNFIYNYGFTPHAFMPIALVTFAMAFGGRHKIFLVRFIFCTIYFSAGLSKLRNGGLEWIFSESLQNILLRSDIYFHDVHSFGRSLALNLQLAPHLVFTKILAGFTLLMELAAPLALFSKKLRYPIVTSLLGMQIAIYFLIFVNFSWYACLFIFWIDWEEIWKRINKFHEPNTLRETTV